MFQNLQPLHQSYCHQIDRAVFYSIKNENAVLKQRVFMFNYQVSRLQWGHCGVNN